MRSWIKTSLLVVALFALCWGGAIAYWQTTNRMPSIGDLALYMLVLPLALLLGVWLLRKGMGAMAAAPAVAVAAPAASAARDPGKTEPVLELLAGALRTAHGASVEELAEAIEGGTARPGLDPELLDDDGYPIMSARVDAADDEDLRVEIEAWLAAHGHTRDFDSEQWRALVLGTGVVNELAFELAAHELLGQDGGKRVPTLQLLPLLSPTWREEQRRAAAEWLRQCVAQAGWPLERISARAPVQGHVASLITQLRAQAHSGEPVLALVVALDSHIGEASVNALSAAGTLFVASRPQGLVPGEGAAAVLLADRTQARHLAADVQPLVQSATARREGSADTSRRPDAAVLRKLAAALQDNAGIEAAKVAMVVADTSHRTSRVMELMAFGHEQFAHLDTSLDVKSTGPACGHSGAVAALAALAVARHHAIELDQHVLCIANEDPFERAAMLLTPASLLAPLTPPAPPTT
ncbi:MAG: hypothetical protein ACLGI6_03150 [Gammaproteobacteria bacterium]